MRQLLKFITCGSVDDGKSTLIGHMLYDAKLIFADQKQALELDSKVGSNNGELDYSLLLDGLMAEREQGITIDVAYRYFSTENRSFIVADTPGHEEYTRNMAVGASFADLAVILVDASQGVLEQTKRHIRICSLMGIRDFVFAVNKMDLIDYKRETFLDICHVLQNIMGEFPTDSVQYIPVSATVGDNVTVVSEKMPWYQGKPLLGYLESVETADHITENFYLPIQRVCRPNHTFRGFQGQIASGTVSVGQEIIILPSEEKAVVEKILSLDKEVQTASQGMAVTLVLNREVDVSRGCILVDDLFCSFSNVFKAQLLWMDETELIAGREYDICITTQASIAAIHKIEYKLDVHTGSRLSSDRLKKNEIAVCEIGLSKRLVLDAFQKHPKLGRFVLIDRITNQTAACGIILHSMRRSDNLVWQNLEVTRQIRSEKMHQEPKTVWFTGLSGAGKSTIANIVEKKLVAEGRYTMLLDGDNVRMGLNRDLGFTEEDRVENIRRIAEVAKLMNDAGLIVLVAFISPYARDREHAKKIIGESFREVYVSTSLEECERRDVKGLYKKARDGKIPNFTGISSPYEVPLHPDMQVDTAARDVADIADEIIEKFF